MVTPEDEAYLCTNGITIAEVEKQRAALIHGIPYANLVTAATVGNGVESYTEAERKELVAKYDEIRKKSDIVKFVPASGAATRMFKHLKQFSENFDHEEEAINTYLNKKENALTKEFFLHFKDFAFTNLVRKKIRGKYPDFKKMTKGPRFKVVAEMLLKNSGLGYEDLPKGLVPFHKYIKYYTTAFEEQLYETAFYAASSEGAKLHFTFAEEHLDKFKEVYTDVKKRVTKKTKTDFAITYSFQKKETNTIAVDNQFNLIRTAAGQLLLRPSGHGALLSNLNDIDADIVFIKNIDNVVSEDYVPEIAHYKKLLAGKLVDTQKQVFKFIQHIDEGVDLEKLNEIKSFVWNNLYCKSKPETAQQLRAILNRPIRVCGVVQNTGAPGGGPFWVRDNDTDSLQIVEAAQIDINEASQKKSLEEATYFNPVDLVCGVRDYQGKKFDLLDFRDADSGFITQKSYNGVPIKVLELPGLWNGAMARWNTIFVEVPLSTFSPVKTVNDLIKKVHRPLA